MTTSGIDSASPFMAGGGYPNRLPGARSPEPDPSLHPRNPRGPLGRDKQGDSLELSTSQRYSEEDSRGLDRTGHSAPSAGSKEKADNPNELTEQEKEQVRELETVDREVRIHEQAHVAAGGAHVVGGIQYEYVTGPDGKSYAVGGEVHLDVSFTGGNPEENLQKAIQIRRAATAASDPSPQDMRVAAMAQQMILEAKREISEKSQDEDESGEGESPLGAVSQTASGSPYGKDPLQEAGFYQGNLMDQYS